VKQVHPEFTPAQVKSALVNSATQDVTDNGATAGVDAVGNGKLNGGGAVQTILTSDPATISFGALNGQTLPLTQSLTIHYAGAGPASFSLSVVTVGSAPIAPTLSPTSLAFVAGGPDQTVTVTLPGTMPTAGLYQGAAIIQGAGTTVRIPYMFVVGSGSSYNLVYLSGPGFDSIVGQQTDLLAFRCTDFYGVAIQGASVRFRVTSGGGSIAGADSQTDNYGIAAANAVLGPNTGAQQFTATGCGYTIPFSGTARLQPAIASGGVLNAASFQSDPGIAPGSYVSIFGTALSDTTLLNSILPLPVALSTVSVSFDVPSAGLSLPGRLLYISPNQVNVQVPWELKDQTSVLMKVSIGFNAGSLYTAKVSNYAPAIFLVGESAAALDENYAIINSANPARRNHTIQVFMNGLGPVDNQPATGEAAKASPLSRTLATVTATIGGVTANVSFSGLAPGFEGLNQVNIDVPAGAPTGVQPLVVSTGGISSPPVNLPVQ
jgi:uncharacterized protein (TIGR03437 family)